MNESDVVKFQIPLAYQPGQISKNKYCYSKEVIKKAFDEAMERPGGLHICLYPNKAELDWDENIVEDVRYAVGTVTDVDDSFSNLTCTIDVTNKNLVSTRVGAGFKGCFRGVGTLTDKDDYIEVNDDLKIITYELSDRY